FTTDVNETGPMSLSPPTRPVPPPPSLNIIVAAWAGCGASQVARLAAAANSDELDRVTFEAVGQKLSAASGERMTASPEWSCRILAFGSLIEQTPTLIIGVKVSPPGRDLRSNTTPAGVSLSNSGSVTGLA